MQSTKLLENGFKDALIDTMERVVLNDVPGFALFMLIGETEVEYFISEKDWLDTLIKVGFVDGQDEWGIYKDITCSGRQPWGGMHSVEVRAHLPHCDLMGTDAIDFVHVRVFDCTAHYGVNRRKEFLSCLKPFAAQQHDKTLQANTTGY